MGIFTDETVYTVRPKDCSEKENACYDALEKLGIPYERVSHQSIGKIEDCGEIEGVLGVKICKNLFLCNAQKTDFYLVVMPGDKSFKTKLLSPQLGCSRLSFAPPEYMDRLIRCKPGSASLLGLLFDQAHKVRVIIDRDLLSEEFLGCHPCDNTSSLKIGRQELLQKFLDFADHTPTYVNL